ncbi:MAG: hypothetical protein WBP97_13750 [Candidatus Sulfotelmatobacter sp.]
MKAGTKPSFTGGLTGITRTGATAGTTATGIGFSCCGVCWVVATGGCWPCALELELEAVDSSAADRKGDGCAVASVVPDDALALVSAGAGVKLGIAGAGVASGLEVLAAFAFGFALLVLAMRGMLVIIKSDNEQSNFFEVDMDGTLLYYCYRTESGQTILVVAKRIQTAAPLATFFVLCLRKGCSDPDHSPW